MDEESTEAIQTSFDDQNAVTVEDNLLDIHGDDLINSVINDGKEQPDTNGEIQKRGPPKTEAEMRECRYCEFQAEDWPMFAKHVFKPHHIKKVAEAFNIKLANAGFKCDVCSIWCSGQQTFNDHLLGTKHHKALEKKIAEKQKSEGGIRIKFNQSGSIQHKKPYDRVPKRKGSQTKAIGAEVFANYPQPLIGLEYVTEVQVAGQNPRYECSLCDAKFEHDLKFPHLVGQKHRMNVLRIKRPDFVKELHPTSKKRSELTASLLRESIDLELAEGRKEVKTRLEKPPHGSVPFAGQGRGRAGSTGFKRGGRGNSDYSQRGARGSRGMNRGVAYSKRGINKGTYGSFSGPGGSYSSYDGGSYGNESFEYESFRRNSFSYDIPSYSSFDNPSFGKGYQQSSGYGLEYPEREASYRGSDYCAPPTPQIELPRPLDNPAQREISSGLASALGDLSKIVKSEGDASVALQVSNALTQALLQYRMDGDLQKTS